MTISVLTRWTKTDLPKYDVTSANGPWSCFSPFKLGPVPLYAHHWSQNMENAWQYSKVYPDYDCLAYWDWAMAGWANERAVRYPMGKGVKPLYSLWAGEKLDYIEARKRIYIPLYSWAVRMYAFNELMHLRDMSQTEDFAILDYDAYDHRKLGYSWDDVINDPTKKMGHGFVLAMMIEGYL